MSGLKLSVIINAVDRMTKPVRKVMQSSERMTDSIRRQQGELSKLGRMKSDIEHFRKLKTQTRATAQELEESRQHTSRLGRELANTTKPTAKMRQAFEQARRKTKQLQAQQNAQRQTLQHAA